MAGLKVNVHIRDDDEISFEPLRGDDNSSWILTIPGDARKPAYSDITLFASPTEWLVIAEQIKEAMGAWKPWAHD